MLPIVEEDDLPPTRPQKKNSIGNKATAANPIEIISNGSAFLPSSTTARPRCGSRSHRYLNLNIGGAKLSVRAELLLKQEHESLLTQFAKMTLQQRRELADDYHFETDEFYFARPPDETAILADYFMIGWLVV